MSAGLPSGEVPRLCPLPDGFGATVASLHRVAELIVAPAQKPHNEIALEPAPGGFGTPWFEYDSERQRVRVERTELVREIGGEVRRAPLSSLAEAAAIVADLLPADAELADDPLSVDPRASGALADWYGFASSALATLAAEAGAEDTASPPILWPEHFDVAIELGSEAGGERATYGFSPGDEEHAEPYAYVSVWTADVEGELWQASGFRGAELPYAELLGAEDQLGAALDFMRTRRDSLKG